MDSNFAQNANTIESRNGAGFHGDRARSIELLATGIVGLDDILGGGLARNHLYLIEGDPGTGKTTIALQFLMEGTRRGQKGLYVTLSESKAELLEIAESHAGQSMESKYLSWLRMRSSLSPKPNIRSSIPLKSN
jgi:circadian clock protein KaiC